MIERKLFLHIGAEKTGTTDIQRSLLNNEQLLNKHGIHILKCAHTGNNRKLPSYCLDDNDFDDYLLNRNINTVKSKQAFDSKLEKDFEDEISSLSDEISIVIISSEHFHSRVTKISAIEKGYNLFKKYFSDIEVILYLREQASVCQSSYSTVIRAGYSPSIQDYASQCNPNNGYYNYLSLVDKWSEVYKKENFSLTVFEKEKLLNNDLIDDFISKIDPSIIAKFVKSTKRANESFSHIGQLLGITINKTIPKNNPNGSPNKHYSELYELINNFFVGKGRNLAIKEYDEIFFSFHEDNIKINKKIFNKSTPLFKYTPPLEKSESNTNVDKEIEGMIKLFNLLNTSTFEPNINDGDFLRDIALEYEDKDLKKSYILMKMASRFKPHGQFIKDKIVEIEEKLSKQ